MGIIHVKVVGDQALHTFDKAIGDEDAIQELVLHLLHHVWVGGPGCGTMCPCVGDNFISHLARKNAVSRPLQATTQRIIATIPCASRPPYSALLAMRVRVLSPSKQSRKVGEFQGRKKKKAGGYVTEVVHKSLALALTIHNKQQFFACEACRKPGF